MDKTYTMRVAYIFALLLLFTGCSDNPALQSRYQAEKMFHQAESSLDDARALNSKLTREQFLSITTDFENLVEYCYSELSGTDSAAYPVEYNELNYITSQAVIRLSQLYYAQNKFEASATLMNDLLDKVNIPFDRQANIYLNLAQGVQSSGNWDSAYVVYNDILERFMPPVTAQNEILYTVFNLPLYILQVVSFRDNEQTISYELNRAETYYLNFINDYPGTKLEIDSRSNLAKLYEETGQWDKELIQLKELTDPTSKSYNSVLLKTADILGGRLNKFDSAMTLYNFLYERTEERDSVTRAGLTYKKALVLIETGKYADARTLLDEIKKRYPSIYHSSPLYQYNLARSFEKENNWIRAEQEYNLLLEKFRGSTESMMTLLYLVDHFKKNNRSIDAERWFRTADEYFNELAKNGRGDEREARALIYQADLYHRAEQYTRSAEIYLDIYKKFPTRKQGTQALLRAVETYKNKLNQPQTADSLLNILQMAVAKASTSDNSKDLLEN